MTRVALVGFVVVMLLAGCGSSQTYDREEALLTFQKSGLQLVPWHVDGVFQSRGKPFVVLIGTDAEADEAWLDYERMQDADSFDARRANVVVISDGGLRPADRRRIGAALASLPDRGSPVIVAGVRATLPSNTEIMSAIERQTSRDVEEVRDCRDDIGGLLAGEYVCVVAFGLEDCDPWIARMTDGALHVSPSPPRVGFDVSCLGAIVGRPGKHP